MRRVFLQLLCIMILFTAAISRPCAADDESTPALQKIRDQVEEENQKFEVVSVRMKEMEQQLKSTEAKLSQSKKREAEIAAGIKKSEKEGVDLSRQVQALERDAKDLQAHSKQRLRALYLENQQSLAEAVLLISDSSTISRNAYYLNRIRTHDLEVLRRLGELRDELSERRSKLEGVKREQDTLRKKLLSEQAAIKEALGEQKKSQAGLVSQKSKFEQSLTALRAQALRLETVMTSITTSDSTNAVESEKIQPDAPRAAFEGVGLERQKGKLSPPIQGTAVQKFGKRGTQEFSDFVFGKGIEFKAKQGAAARAIAGGKVMFVGAMPAYGKVVIIDHGERSYSLYGLLSSTSVKVSDEVSQNDELGTVGAEAGGKNFYFEVRKNGIAFDPQKLYAERF